MIEFHNCPHCGHEMKMWLPLKIDKPPIAVHDEYGCNKEVDFSFVYSRRNSMSEEMLEREQLTYLKKKYE